MPREDFGFSESQWQSLTHGPLYMLAHVGGADAYIDSAEWAALIGLVRDSAASDDDRLVSALMEELATQLDRGPAQIPGHHPPLDGLHEVARILDEWDVEASTVYRVTLMEIGATIADASGAQLTIRYAVHQSRGDNGRGGWTPSSATGPAEHRALAAAANALGLAVPADRPADQD